MAGRARGQGGVRVRKPRPHLKYSVSQFDGTNVAQTEPNAMAGFGVPMLDIGIALGLALMGFALGYGTREVCFLSTSSGRKRGVPPVGTG